MTSNMIYIVALDVGLKCPRKIHLNTQWGRGTGSDGPDRERVDRLILDRPLDRLTR